MAVALDIKTVKEEGDGVVLWGLQDEGAVHVVGVDVRPAGTLQVAMFLFIGSATAWKSPSASQLPHYPSCSTYCALFIGTSSLFKPNLHMSMIEIHLKA